MPVAVERRLDRGVAELRLDVLRVRPLRDQEAGVRVPQVVEPDAAKLREPEREVTAARHGSWAAAIALSHQARVRRA